MLFVSPPGTTLANGMPKSFVFRLISRLRLTSFAYLNITQFLGAMNDNIFKLLIVYCFITLEGAEASNAILASVGAIYVIPFLLLSQTAGMMADHYSKKTIIVLTKIVEIAVMLLGVLAFVLSSKILAFSGLFFLACHSAVFGPCKYGIVPEIVPQEYISKANGYLTSFTYTAIIIGTFLASFFTDITDRNFILSASFCCLFACIGFFASLFIQKTAPSNVQKKVSALLVTELFHALRIIRNEPSLLSAVIGSAFFLFIGSFIQLNMIPFAINILHLTDVQGGYLFLLTALGIGAGSLLAGKFSGKAVELGLVPIGGIGITICCFLLDFLSDNLYAVIPLVLFVGLFGGIYLVPLDSYIQVTSPKIHRGQVVATCNFLGFFGVLLSAGTLYLISDVLHLDADHGFTIMGFATIGIVIFISISMSGYIVRFFSLLVSKIHFPVALKGGELIPLAKVSFFFVPHSPWPWACILLASQRKRMRLFTTKHHDLPFFGRIACRFIPVIEVDDAEDLLPDGIYGNLITHSIQRGTSVGIFCSKKLFEEYTRRWLGSWQEELNDPALQFFTLTSTGQENLDIGKIKTSLQAKVIQLN